MWMESTVTLPEVSLHDARRRELTLPAAIELVGGTLGVGVSKPTFRDAVRRGLFRADAISEGRGMGYRFDRDELLEDLAALPRCSYPNCPTPALGRSGRCGDHAARGEPAVELTCRQCAKKFVRPRSWLAEREGRGSFCSNECKGLAHAAANPGRLQALNLAGARDHHAAVAAELAALGARDDVLGADVAAERFGVDRRWLLERYRGTGELPAELVTILGSVRVIVRAKDMEQFEREWARGTRADGRRRSWLEPNHAIARLRARGLISTVDEQERLHDRVLARRRLLKRMGAPTATDRHARWRATRDESRRELVRAMGDRLPHRLAGTPRGLAAREVPASARRS
jgi:hypothetical protein